MNNDSIPSNKHQHMVKHIKQNHNASLSIEVDELSSTSIHVGVFDDIPARYETCQYRDSRCDRLVFLSEDLCDRKGLDLLNKLKASRLVRENSPITFNKKPDGCLCIDFNFQQVTTH